MTGAIVFQIFGSTPLLFVFLAIVGALMFILKKTKRI